jgi:hypothetical protein
MTATIKNYGTIWFAQITDENGHYRGNVRRTTKGELLRSIKQLFGKVQIVEVK